MNDRAKVRESCAAMLKVLGKEYDPMRQIWDRETSERDRRFLLLAAGKSAIYTDRTWDQLPSEVRGYIRNALVRFKGWAERVQQCAA